MILDDNCNPECHYSREISPSYGGTAPSDGGIAPPSCGVAGINLTDLCHQMEKKCLISKQVNTGMFIYLLRAYTLVAF